MAHSTSSMSRRIRVLALGSIPNLRSLEAYDKPRFKVTNSVTVEDLPSIKLALYDLVALPEHVGFDGLKRVIQANATVPVVIFGEDASQSPEFVYRGAQDYLSSRASDLPFRLLSVIERFRRGGYALVDDTGEFDAATRRVQRSIERLLGGGDDTEGGPEGAAV